MNAGKANGWLSARELLNLSENGWGFIIGGGRTPVQFRLSRLNSNAAGVSGNGRGRDHAFRFNRSTSAWKAGVSSAIRVSMSRT